MGRDETLYHTRFGEMMDLIACLSIYDGGADPKPKKLSYEESIMLK